LNAKTPHGAEISKSARIQTPSTSPTDRPRNSSQKSTSTLRLKLFDRRHGRYVPTPEANDIFEQINGGLRGASGPVG